jgi:hypothetical protein
MDEALARVRHDANCLVEDLRRAYPMASFGAQEIVIEQLLESAVKIQQTLARLQQGR